MKSFFALATAFLLVIASSAMANANEIDAKQSMQFVSALDDGLVASLNSASPDARLVFANKNADLSIFELSAGTGNAFGLIEAHQKGSNQERFCLMAPLDSTVPRAAICNETDFNQLWKVQSDSKGTISTPGNKCLAYEGSKPAVGDQLHLITCGSAEPQGQFWNAELALISA